ncbi:MAG: hypothetical protein ABFC28_09820 [Rikenellaceae bacterium]
MANHFLIAYKTILFTLITTLLLTVNPVFSQQIDVRDHSIKKAVSEISSDSILIRETDKSQWERKLLVQGTSVKVPLSRDNFFFGVQYVDESGHESLPVFATGIR